MATLATVRAGVLTKLAETASNSHFQTADLNGFINEAVEFTSVFVENARQITSTQAVYGQSDYSNPTDNVILRTAYFGDLSILGDVRPLKVITEETLKELFPSWLETNPAAFDRPMYLIQKTKNLFTVYPTPDTANSAAGKKIHQNYGYIPAVLVNDSDIPDLPTPYHNLLQFYALHLCYIVLKNVDMAKYALDVFSAKLKIVQPVLSRETKEGLRFQWAETDDLSDGWSPGTLS